MGDPQTLIDFITRAKTNYPADHYSSPSGTTATCGTPTTPTCGDGTSKAALGEDEFADAMAAAVPSMWSPETAACAR
jgi:hypothetical protein